jgi:hypothetical protein
MGAGESLAALCVEFRIEPTVLESLPLAAPPTSNVDAGFIVPEEDFEGHFAQGSRSGRSFVASGIYTGLEAQVVVGTEPLAVVTLSRRTWTVEVAPYAACWDGLLPAAYRPRLGRAVLEVWPWPTVAPSDPVLSEELVEALRVSSARRRATFLACAVCDTATPPEQLFGGTTCARCALERR